jgi:WD40 repeat protein
MSFSSDGTLVAAGGTDDNVMLFDANDGKLVRKFAFVSKDPSQGGIVGVAFRPGQSEIAAACKDRRMRFWRTSDGEAARDEMRTSFLVDSLCFSSNGAEVLVTSRWGGSAVRTSDFSINPRTDQNKLKLYKSTSSQSHHLDDITSACYGEDTDENGAFRLVMTTSRDKTAAVWRTSDGTPIAHCEGFPTAVLCGALGSDGEHLRAITGCEDGCVRVWPVDPLPAALARYPRDLTEGEEWREQQQALPLVY